MTIGYARTVALKHDKEVYIGKLKDDCNKDCLIEKFIPLSLTSDVSITSDKLYIIMISSNKDTEVNDIFFLEDVPLIDANGQSMSCEEITNSINDGNLSYLANQLLAKFNNNVTIH